MVRAIVQEIALQKDYLKGELVETIYFGGGTPSLLLAEEIDELLYALRQHHTLSAHAEITLEANPDDLSMEKLKGLVSCGINRLSIGVQSFDDAILKSLNRAHSVDEARRCIQQAQEVGIDNISLDLIYSIPGQDNALLKRNIAEALALHPTHISTYSLTIEEKTVFGKWKKSGKFSPMEEGASADQFELVMDSLIAAGFEHYEISNFAKPDHYARHNTSYWQQKKYLGLGPSAHSYDLNSRQFNVSNNAAYLKSISVNELPFEKEVLSRQDKINEYLFTSLRTQWGINSDYLMEHFQYDIRKTSGFQALADQGLVDDHYPRVTLTRKGKLLADQVAASLFV